jgi:UDP-N-acetylglucosamine 4,6-dehydratase
MIDGQSVLVTGGTGSFGRRFVQTVLARYYPKRLIVFSRDELKQHEMAQWATHDSMRFFIGDVRDAPRLAMACEDVDIIVHAAALKHVPALEYNPMEAVKTNILGTENVISAALARKVGKVIVLSTDKAVAPINLYGATKLAADKLAIAANNMRGRSGARFSVARYGNVIGSRGSVIPHFQKLVREGADRLPVTDLRMTRFLISLQQGVDFVLRCLERMHGGETFVPKIPSATIETIARAVAPGLALEAVGIRPGEKLHEVLLPRDLSPFTLEFDDFYLTKPSVDLFHRAAYETTALDERGTLVPDGFECSSNDHAHLLGADGLASLIGSAAPFDE